MLFFFGRDVNIRWQLLGEGGRCGIGTSVRARSFVYGLCGMIADSTNASVVHAFPSVSVRWIPLDFPCARRLCGCCGAVGPHAIRDGSRDTMSRTLHPTKETLQPNEIKNTKTK